MKHKPVGKYTLAEIEEMLKRFPLAWGTHEALIRLKDFVEKVKA